MNTPIIENIIANKVPQKAFVPFCRGTTRAFWFMIYEDEREEAHRERVDEWSSPVFLDTRLSTFLLKQHRDFIPDSWMFSLTIVVRFYVLEYRTSSRLSGRISFSVNQFNFQRMKETFHRRIVITGCSTTHGTAQTRYLDQPLVRGWTILTTSVGMNNHAPRQPPTK